MKVLEVNGLELGIDKIVKAINEKRTAFEALQKAIGGLINLDDGFNGKGAEAIKSFYEDCHTPFITKTMQILSDYDKKLVDCRNAVDALEPSQSGFIRQPFLQNDLSQSLGKAKTYTEEVTNEANDVISSIQDITPIPQIDDSTVIEDIGSAEKNIEETITKLEEFDYQQTVSLQQLKNELHLLEQYITDMKARVSSGQLTVNNYSATQLMNFHSRFSLVMSIRPEMSDLIPVPHSAFEYIMNKREALSMFLGFYPLGFSKTFESQGEPSSVSKDGTYLIGDTVEKNGFKVGVGAGKIENKWNEEGQIGGKSSFVGIHAGMAHDTKIIDSEFNQNIGMAEGQASIGGESIFPLLKASGSVYNIKAKAQLDKDLTLIGRAGAEAQGDILKANAYAGVDNSSIGIGAKAAVAEGEVSGIIPIPFTNINVKGTVGGSALGIGGEAKIGKETVLDLRFILGVKLGISFEKAN
ncbi:ribonuclease YeeF family protein [Mesobacillus zeae]|uniref:LXG domain-containing protein n=1 Tax=Mesobacillus zeae TaxID=1917180 RepID=A0A398BBC3_9BACI|nr:LXG domain-containing protein [Mesobacillus zeae]RID86741.1 hypothetical protein D1970_05650 [Mesobacillus zeae]